MTYEWFQKVRVFVLGKPFLPSVMKQSNLLGPLRRQGSVVNTTPGSEIPPTNMETAEFV
jgi:hypothetical protein